MNPHIDLKSTVNPHMAYKMYFSNKILITLGALSLSLPSMNLHMYFKLGFYPVWIIKWVIRFIPSMVPQMFIQNTLHWKKLSHWLHWCDFSPKWILIWLVRLLFNVIRITLGTIIWSLPSMNSHMYFKIAIIWKSCHIGCMDMVYSQCESSYDV